MIIVKIMGGVGNQMFQYATALRLSQANNTLLKLDTSNFANKDKKTTPRSFVLNNFNISAQIATTLEIKYFKKFKKVHTKIWGRIYNPLFADDSKYITEKYYGFNPKILNLKDDIYLDGYWQSEKYFKGIRKVLIDEFSLKTQSSTYKEQLQLIVSRNSISIHVRRGDYASKKELVENYGLCNLDYYKKGIDFVAQKIKNPHFFIFSDDIEWVRKNLEISYPSSYISKENLEDHEELILMSKCAHNIIANSSFSWWGAWLNINTDKMVISPKRWFLNESFIPKDIIPENWIKM